MALVMGAGATVPAVSTAHQSKLASSGKGAEIRTVKNPGVVVVSEVEPPKISEGSDF